MVCPNSHTMCWRLILWNATLANSMESAMQTIGLEGNQQPFLPNLLNCQSGDPLLGWTCKITIFRLSLRTFLFPESCLMVSQIPWESDFIPQLRIQIPFLNLDACLLDISLWRITVFTAFLCLPLTSCLEYRKQEHGIGVFVPYVNHRKTRCFQIVSSYGVSSSMASVRTEMRTPVYSITDILAGKSLVCVQCYFCVLLESFLGRVVT